MLHKGFLFFMGDTFYFSHDYTARLDVKIKSLIRKHGYLGYGIYWAIVEDLYINDNKLPANHDDIAYDLHSDSETVKSIISDFSLFTIDNGVLSSASVQKRLDKRNEKSIKAAQSARLKWDNANAMRTQSERNAIKKSKVKESKVNKEDIDIEPDADASAKNEKFIKFQEWQKDNTPSLLEMKEPFTEEQFLKLKQKLHYSKIIDVCQRMHNHNPLLNKYKSAYLTFENWLKNETK